MKAVKPPEQRREVGGRGEAMALYQFVGQKSYILMHSKTILGVFLLTGGFGFTLFLRNQQLLFIAIPYFLLPGLLGVWSAPG